MDSYKTSQIYYIWRDHFFNRKEPGWKVELYFISDSDWTMKQNQFPTTIVSLIFSLKIFLALSLGLIEIKKKGSSKGLKAHSEKATRKGICMVGD